uniref:Uncharacterized protein n=1 Tax=Oryza meridionalis TaxID=40149 RepID=A0A0E0DC87_9ORYZ
MAEEEACMRNSIVASVSEDLRKVWRSPGSTRAGFSFPQQFLSPSSSSRSGTNTSETAVAAPASAPLVASAVATRPQGSTATTTEGVAREAGVWKDHHAAWICSSLTSFLDAVLAASMIIERGRVLAITEGDAWSIEKRLRQKVEGGEKKE